MGERALICLARAILRNSRVVLLDEASAQLDSKSDELIQQTIRTRFKDATMLVIAHRLNTVVDLDSVFVIDQGELAEHGHAHLLMSDPNSKFSKLVRETGEENKRLLKRISFASYRNLLSSSSSSSSSFKFTNSSSSSALLMATAEEGEKMKIVDEEEEEEEELPHEE